MIGHVHVAISFEDDRPPSGVLSVAVRREMNSRSAISGLVSRSAASRTTRSSVSVSDSPPLRGR